MKKTTILSVMAVLWLNFSSRAVLPIYKTDTVKVQLWNFELVKHLYLVDTLISTDKGVFQFKIPKVAGNIYFKVSAVKNQRARNVIINPILLNGLDEVLINLNNKEVREVSGTSKSVIVAPNFDDLNLKLQLDTVNYHQKTTYQKQVYVLEEKLKAELATLKTNKALYLDEVYSASRLDRISLNNYYRLLAAAGVLKNADKSPLGNEDTKVAIRFIDEIYNDTISDRLTIENLQYRKMLLKAIELKFVMANSQDKNTKRDTLILAHIKNNYTGIKQAWLWAHYFSMVYARMSPGDVVGLKRKFNEAFAGLPREVVLAVNGLGFQSDETFWFSLAQHSGKVFRLKEFLGKVVLIDFWYTGCSNCIVQHQKVLSPLFGVLGKDKAFGFVDVSIDKAADTWKRSVGSGEYTLPGAVHVYTEGLGSNHPLIKHYKISSYPSTIVLDKYGRSYNVNHIASDLEKLRVFLESLKNQ